MMPILANVFQTKFFKTELSVSSFQFAIIATGGLAVTAFAGALYAAFGHAYVASSPVALEGPPKRSILKDLSIYLRVHGVRLLGEIIHICLLPRPKPSEVFNEKSPAGNPVKCLAYYPTGYARPNNHEKPLGHVSPPVYINAHAGGFIAGASGDDDEYCRYLAAEAGIIVLSVDYRLAPEHSPPTAAIDLVESAKWASKFFHSSKVVFGGFSAGGTLALSAATFLSSHPTALTVEAAVAFYPPTDLSSSSINDFPDKNPYGKMIYYEAYLRNTPLAMLQDPLVSPACAPPESFPPVTVLIAAGQDPNKGDLCALAQRLAGCASTRLTWRQYQGLPHGWTHIPDFVLATLGRPRAQGGPGTGLEAKWDAYSCVARALREALATEAAEAQGGGGS